MQTFSAKQAAEHLQVDIKTVKRWLKRIQPSISVPLDARRRVWRWTPADLRRFARFKAQQKRGPKPKKKRKR